MDLHYKSHPPARSTSKVPRSREQANGRGHDYASGRRHDHVHGSEDGRDGRGHDRRDGRRGRGRGHHPQVASTTQRVRVRETLLRSR